MAVEVYSAFNDKMGFNLGAVDGVIDARVELMVPDGLWLILGKMNLDNDTPIVQVVDSRLAAGGEYDRNIVRLGPSGAASWDTGFVGFTLLHHFTGTNEARSNPIRMGVFHPTSDPPKVSAGRAKITAIRVNSYINEAFG